MLDAGQFLIAASQPQMRARPPSISSCFSFFQLSRVLLACLLRSCGWPLHVHCIRTAWPSVRPFFPATLTTQFRSVANERRGVVPCIADAG
jgi:hypothetical protein